VFENGRIENYQLITAYPLLKGSF